MGQSSDRLAATFSAHHAPEPAIPSPGQSLLDGIGNTPLLRFDQLTTHLPGVRLLGKAEWHNPGGSVKDRAAANIVAEGRRSSQFAPGKILLDATSGNTGIAYAMLSAAEGFPVTLCMPQNVSAERKKILSAYGANIIYTDPGDGSDGAIRMARELAAKHPIKGLQCRQDIRKRWQIQVVSQQLLPCSVGQLNFERLGCKRQCPLSASIKVLVASHQSSPEGIFQLLLTPQGRAKADVVWSDAFVMGLRFLYAEEASGSALRAWLNSLEAKLQFRESSQRND